MNYYNNKTFAKEISKRTGVDFPVQAIYRWRKKKLITPNGFMANGKRSIPVWSESDVVQVMGMIKVMQANGTLKTALRVYVES